MIIPIYNAAPFLCRCIESVLSQSFADFEIILVDDGSTDESYSICTRYAAQDTRIRLFHKENGGVVSARNHGLSYALGGYICWCDADDELAPNYLRDLVEDCRFGGGFSDLVIQGHIRIHSKGREISLPSSSSHLYRFPEDINLFFDCVNIRDHGVSIGKVFRRSIIQAHHLEYSQNILLAEDLDFLLRYLSYCRYVCVSTKTNYHYVLREGSVSHQIYSFSQELSGLQQLSLSWNSLSRLYPDTVSLIKQQALSITDYVHRVVLSCYQGQYSLMQRLQLLHDIPQSFMSCYCTTERPTRFLSFISWLFYHRLYLLADMILCLRLNCIFFRHNDN